jgi:hypothetical protein
LACGRVDHDLNAVDEFHPFDQPWQLVWSVPAPAVLRGLVDRVEIGPAKIGLEVEIGGEIAKMVELGIGNKTNEPPSVTRWPVR